MKKKHLLLSFFVAITLVMINTTEVSSNITAPPAGNTGDASSANTCGRVGCHATSPQTPANGDVTFNIGTGTPTTPITSSFQYVPGTVYNIGFVINQTASRYGFQVSAADSALVQAGTFALTNTTNNTLSTAFGRSYVGHKNASSIKTWGFKWTAPVSGTGPVTFYYTYNLANADGMPGGDAIFKNSVTIVEQTVGVQDISEKISAFNIFPNPATSDFGLSFDLKESSDVTCLLYSLDGKISHQLMSDNLGEGSFNQSFNIENIPAGIYLVKLNVGAASVTRKITKL
jgi:hypothetical protein